MKHAKTTAIIMAVSMVLCVGTLCLAVMIRNNATLAEENTTLCFATVHSVEITDMGEGVFAEIYTKEYDNPLYLSTNIGEYLPMEVVQSLKNGQSLWFRVENAHDSQIDAVDFIPIVSLKTDEKEIFSLADYNTYMRHSTRPVQIASVVMALLFLLISVVCWTRIRHLKRS